MGSDADIANWEEIVLWVIVGIDVDFSCGYENEGRVDIDGEFDVSIFISVYFKFGFFLVVVEWFVIFLFFILYFLFYDFIDLAEPLHTG